MGDERVAYSEAVNGGFVFSGSVFWEGPGVRRSSYFVEFG